MPAEPRPGTESVRVVAPRRSATTLSPKRLAQGLFDLPVRPRLADFRIRRQVLGSRAFGAASESIARVINGLDGGQGDGQHEE